MIPSNEDIGRLPGSILRIDRESGFHSGTLKKLEKRNGRVGKQDKIFSVFLHT